MELETLFLLFSLLIHPAQLWVHTSAPTRSSCLINSCPCGGDVTTAARFGPLSKGKLTQPVTMTSQSLPTRHKLLKLHKVTCFKSSSGNKFYFETGSSLWLGLPPQLDTDQSILQRNVPWSGLQLHKQHNGVLTGWVHPPTTWTVTNRWLSSQGNAGSYKYFWLYLMLSERCLTLSG